jgi:hypothetical protein
MKKMFTKTFSAILVMAFTLTGIAVKAQQTVLASATTLNQKVDTKTDSVTVKAADKVIVAKAADAAWVPTRRLWGYAFGDFYYAPHIDASNRGAETNYNGVPANRNAFQFRRVYLGYDYDIDQKFAVELLLSTEPAANTGVNGTTAIQNGDNLVDGKMAFWIKNINLRWKGVWTGTDFVIGEMSTPTFPLLAEKIWSYRSIEKTIADFHKNNSYDVGVALQGVFDPATKNYGYNFMIGDNSQANLLSAANANTGFFKAFYLDVFAKFMDQKLIFDLYGDYMQTASGTAVIGQQSRNMLKAFVAYTTPQITVGVEAYTQKIKNGLNNETAGAPADATVHAFTVFTRGMIVKDKLNFFARYDGYNPDSDFNGADVYTANTNFSSYSPFTKETFETAGLDFTPTKNVHFMPNLWYISYKDQRNTTTTGYLAPGHVAVARLTFFYTFGK